MCDTQITPEGLLLQSLKNFARLPSQHVHLDKKGLIFGSSHDAAFIVAQNGKAGKTFDAQDRLLE